MGRMFNKTTQEKISNLPLREQFAISFDKGLWNPKELGFPCSKSNLIQFTNHKYERYEYSGTETFEDTYFRQRCLFGLFEVA